MQGPTFKSIISYLLGIFLLSSCTQINDLSPYPVHFDAAIRQLSKHLLEQIKQNKTTVSLAQINVAIDPFIDTSTSTVVNASREIERIIVDESKQIGDFVIRRISTENLREAHYVISGIIDLEDYKIGLERDKYYHVKASVSDLKQGEIIANTGVWLLDADLDHAVDSIHKNNPFYLKDDKFEALVEAASGQVGESVNQEYYDFLDTNALLVEAESVYEKKDYKTALILFKQAIERDDGKIMRTYAGLYETYAKLGDEKSAKAAFDTLLDMNIQHSKKLNLKLLFTVNSTQFVKNQALRQRYAMWLQRISDYFKKNEMCFNIVGHTSRTGSMHYNDRLSLERARTIQNLMKIYFPNITKKSKIIGKGFRENIVGLGTDDARDAIDRRVEFITVDCPL